MLTIEICPKEPRAEYVSGMDEYADDINDCNASGDVESACAYIRDHIGVSFSIVARNASGEYENRAATDAEITETARAIFFDSETDFTDMDNAYLYLIWSAAWRD